MGGFKKSFLSDEQLRRHAPIWAGAWSEDAEKFQRALIHPAEFCARIVISVYQTLFGSRFTNGSRSESWIYPMEWSALNFLGKTRVRALPETAALALLRWGRGEISLEVFERIPTPMEVLKLQTQGIRCLSVFHREEDLIGFRHEGRDFFSFLIHDLIHAQLMTESREAFDLQKKFAHVIHENWPVLDVNLSAQARGELEYMASDMNSHIVHLTLTLKSWTDRHRADLSARPEFSRFWRALDLIDEERAHREIFETWKNLEIGRP